MEHHSLLLLALQALCAVALRSPSAGQSAWQPPVQACSTESKDIDLVIFGATGFTGRFASKYIAERSTEDLRWAVAARNSTTLDALDRDLAAKAKSRPLVMVADLNDYDSLLRITRRARAVVSYVGPYEMLGGEALIRACIEGCASYADVTGEVAWVAEMIGKHGAKAEARGVALVPFAGFDALPADLMALSAAEALAADGNGPPSEITVLYNELNSAGFSGASLASGRYMVEHHGAITDPYILAPDTPEDARVDHGVSGERKLGFSQLFFAKVDNPISASQDCPVMRRSLARRFPGARISVAELVATDAVAAKSARYRADARALLEPPKIPTNIGDSPPVWMEEKGSYAGEVLARRASPEAQTRMTFEGHGSPSYLGTARLSAELALGLALEGAAGGGFLTPSLALPGGPAALARRLADSGYEHLKAKSGA